MKLDSLKQFAKLRQQLTDEKGQIETRLNEINQVLGSPSVPNQPSPTPTTAEMPRRPAARRGRKPRGDNSMSLKEAVVKALANGPLARKDLVQAVENVGYVFTTNKPLNSIGGVLYAKNSPVKSRLGKFFVEGAAASGGVSHGNGFEAQAIAPRKKKRKLSPAGRAAISLAAKQRWARKRASK